MLFCWDKKQHLKILVYVSYFLCVYCAQCDVLCDFCMKRFCCSMKTKTIVSKHIWCLCKLQNKNFSMVCCTTLWWDGAGKGRGWKTAAVIYCWQQQQHVRGRTAQLSDISSGATWVADLDSGALALTKEASGNSRVPNYLCQWVFIGQITMALVIVKMATTLRPTPTLTPHTYLYHHLASHHWLPFDSHRQYKFSSLCNSCLHTSAPSYFPAP